MAYTVTVIPGEGTGHELTAATMRVLEATGINFSWDVHHAGLDAYRQTGTLIPASTLASLRRTRLAGVSRNGGIAFDAFDDCY